MANPPQDVFLSYSREDQSVARRYAEGLQQEGLTVWWDQKLSTGEAYDEVTEAALEGAKAVVVLWSKRSVASRWVRAEATTADRSRILAPVMTEECKRPVMFELTQAAELAHWKGDLQDPAWRSFIADLWRMVRRGEPEVAAEARVVSRPSAASPRRRRVVTFALVAAALFAITTASWGLIDFRQKARAREAIPEIARLAEAGDYVGAYARAEQVRRELPDDPALKTLSPQFTTRFSISTEPDGASVSVRGYDSPADSWRVLGKTPLQQFELPRSVLRWRIEKQGFETVELATPMLERIMGPTEPTADDSSRIQVALRRGKEQPPEMIFVPAGTSARLVRVASAQVPAFLMDRYEVSNAEFKEFIAAGGYERRTWWEGLDIRKGGRPLEFEAAMRLFVDATGKPGPSTWELGSYPDGKGEHPVSGISWYEAVAYSRFRGKSLPTASHWARASLPANELDASMAASITPLSNFGSSGTSARGASRGMGPYGTYDMFGNVREWLLNSGADGGLVIGGDWQDVAYSFGDVVATDRLERTPLNGMRLMKSLDAAQDDLRLRAPVELVGSLRSDFRNARAVSDEAYRGFLEQFAYKSGPANASAPVTMAETEYWTKQKVTIDAGYNSERLDLILFIPKQASPPFQPVVFFSGIQIVLFPDTVDHIEPGFQAYPLDYVVKSGRVLVQPVFQGTFERMKSPMDFSDQVRTTHEWIERRWDLGRTMDYLEMRSDIDAKRAGFIGISFGASYALPLLATEPRLKAAVFLSGGYPSAVLPPVIDPVNFVPRIRIPVLMVNGRFDQIIPVETRQRPMFEQLGTPARDKRYVLLDFGHGSPPRAEVLRETLGWLDKYLGPVNH